LFSVEVHGDFLGEVLLQCSNLNSMTAHKQGKTRTLESPLQLGADRQLTTLAATVIPAKTP
jgi:hypothetical protein